MHTHCMLCVLQFMHRTVQWSTSQSESKVYIREGDRRSKSKRVSEKERGISK